MLRLLRRVAHRSALSTKAPISVSQVSLRCLSSVGSTGTAAVAGKSPSATSSAVLQAPPAAAASGVQVGRRRGNDRVPWMAGVVTAAGLIPFVWYAFQHDAIVEEDEQGVAGGSPLRGRAPRGDRVIKRVQAYCPIDLSFLLCRDQVTVRERFNNYAACILTFLGAVHWGLALGGGGGIASLPKIPLLPPSQHPYLISVLPSLLAWYALCLETVPPASPNSVLPAQLMGVGFVLVYLYDEALLQRGEVPRWYTKVRTPASTGVLISVVALTQLSKDSRRGGS